MVDEYERLKTLYLAQDAAMATAFFCAVGILLGYVLLSRRVAILALLRRVYVSLMVGLYFVLIYILMTVTLIQGKTQ